MICYAHPTCFTSPPWLEGVGGLMSRTVPIGVESWFGFGLGHQAILGNAPDDAETIDGGWKVWVNGIIDPHYLQRHRAGCPTITVEAVDGGMWAAPVVLTHDGHRNFTVSYGRDWKPEITPEQKDLIEFARLAAAEVPRYLRATPAEQEDMLPRFCHWAAVGLSYVNAVTPEVLQALRVLDTKLVLLTLSAMAGGIYVAEPAEANA